MNRRHLVAFAIAFAVLVPLAPMNAVASSHAGLVVGSQHTDFGTGGETAPQTLTNLSISGSGDSASVVLDGGANGTIDDFEDGDITEYVEDTGSWSAQTGTVFEGTYAAQGSSTGTSRIHSTSGLPTYPSVGDTISARVQVSAAAVGGIQFGVQDANNRYEVLVDDKDDRFAIAEWQSGSFNVRQTISVSIPSGEWTRVEVDWDQSGSDVVITARLYDASGSQIASVSWTDTNSPFTSGGVGMVQSNGETVYVDDFKIVGAGFPDSAEYLSATHNITNGQQANFNITQASNVSVEAVVQTPSGTTLNSSTFTGTGNHTVQIPNYSGDQLETYLNVSITGSNPQFSLADESILFANHAPEVALDSPPDGKMLNQSQVTLEATISDAEFPTAQGDSVTAEFQTRGPGKSTWTTRGTDTLTSNGTASTTFTASTGGTLDWRVVATDSYGASTTSSIQTFKTPSTLTVYNETQPSQIVNNTNVTVQFFGSDKIVSKEVSDGTINLTGLPTDEQLIVTADADGFYGRTVTLDDLYEQSSVYLLNKSTTAVETRFVLDDRSGEFGENSEVIIEKPLTINGTTNYERIVADEFGVKGVTTFLDEGERYRISVRNTEGDVRVIGSYTPTTAETVTLQPGALAIEIPEKGGVNYDAWFSNVSNNPKITFEYVDTSNSTTSVSVEIYERGNQSNVLMPNTTYDSGPYGSLRVTEPMTANQSETTWVVKWHANRETEDVGGTLLVNQGKRSIMGFVPEWIQQWVAAGMILMTGGLFSRANVGVGAVSTAAVGGLFWWFGFLGGASSGMAVVIAMAGAIAMNYGEVG